jgi:AcrR family transcriptional regulator
VLGAAAEVFAERGYDGTTVAFIAERAGLTTGSIYMHFSGKADLLAEAIETIAREQDVHTSALRRDPAVRTGLRRDFLDDAWRWVDPTAAAERVVALEAHAACRRDDELRGRLAALDEERISAVVGVIADLQAQGVIDREVDARALAVWFVLVPLGAAQLEAAGVKLPNRKAWLSVVERVLAGMLARD